MTTADTLKRLALTAARDALGVGGTAIDGADDAGLESALETAIRARDQLFRAWGHRVPRLGSEALRLLSALETMESALHREREAREVDHAAQLERERHEAALCPVRFEHNVGVAADGRWFFWRAGKHGMCAGWTPERERIRFLAPFEQLAARVLQVEPDWRHPDAPLETP